AAAAAAAASAPQTRKGGKKAMMGKWTADQVNSALRQYPQHANQVAQLASQYTFPECFALLAKSGPTLDAALAASAACGAPWPAFPIAAGPSTSAPPPAAERGRTLARAALTQKENAVKRGNRSLTTLSYKQPQPTPSTSQLQATLQHAKNSAPQPSTSQ
ncbi:hypothetical protein PENTCL1PPCAC_29941, partial [Pristionchus entomophagus]